MTEGPVHSQLVTIRNEKGLHARASAKFVKCAEEFDAEVFVTRDDQRVGGTSIMGLLMLAAGPGVTLLIEASGQQAEAALASLASLVNEGFGEGCIDDT
ncbi:MAG: HPr family phosphocarrier protein [Pseudomonadota bacterium]